MCGHVRSVLTRSLSHYHKSKQWAPYLELTLKEIKLCLKIYNKPVKNYSLVLTGSVLSPFFSLTLSHLICSMHVPDTAVEKCSLELEKGIMAHTGYIHACVTVVTYYRVWVDKTGSYSHICRCKNAITYFLGQHRHLRKFP